MRLWLRFNGRVVPLAQIGPDQIILTAEEPVPAGAAEVLMSVDGWERRWSVEVGPATPGSPTLPIRLLGDSEPR